MQTVVSPKKIGILLVNLGTPEAASYGAIRRYLSEFLSDRRVIEMNPLIWQPILQGIILTVRPFRIVKPYRMIWDNQENKSPLSVITERQIQKLQSRFKNKPVLIDWAMSYGKPSIEQKISHFLKKQFYHLFLLPLYPQYSATTTASVNDKLFRILQKYRKQPAIRTMFSFADHPVYVQALYKQIEMTLNSLSEQPERIILSFHGLPQTYVDRGDPYEQECQKTATALRKMMNKDERYMPLVYQSRFGPGKWLEPNITDVIKKLVTEGVRNIAVMAPGFITDCLETIEEIGHQYKALFLKEGGKKFIYIPCLNDGEIGIDMLEGLINEELRGWI
ncbi:ferrochelatase [Commensalibacter sp. M0357]|uniref:ferrochelatase n=1 Tax=unclassified Commensalibacter TaxID=2630218 RepID=UPI0018DB51B2|nr:MULTISPECIES: ferrochelatase [unclassified Commensalibacter]MBI0075112.1 ferrochelatase [Commensalibacter sp. M0357]MBI0084954.1 ferrochelatase [Commensalibacter sp. M0355]